MAYRKINTYKFGLEGEWLPVADDFSSDAKEPVIIQRKSGSLRYSTDSSKITILEVPLSANDKNALRTDNAPIEISLEKSIGPIKRMWLECEVKQSATQGYLLPMPYWFKSIELKVKGSNTTIKTWYPEEMLMQLSVLDANERECLKSDMNFGSNSWLSKAKVQQPQASTSTRFRMPILHNPVELSAVNMKTAHADLIYRLVFRAASENPAVGITPTIDSMRIICEEYQLSTEDELEQKKYYMHNNVGGDYLDFQRISIAQILTDGTECQLDLRNVTNCYSPFIFMTLRALANPDDSVADKNLNTYYNLGPNALVKFRSNGLQSLYESSNSLVQSQVRSIAQRLFGDSDLLKRMPFYVIPFNKFPMLAVKSASWLGGCFTFDGANANIGIKPFAGTRCAQGLNLGPAPTAGSYYFVYRGQYSEPVAFNAAVDDMKKAFENIPAAKADGLIVTFNAQLNVSGSITATFDVANGDVDLIQIVGNQLVATGTVLVGCVATYTTRGVAGITSGANYVVDIYIAQYKQLAQVSELDIKGNKQPNPGFNFFTYMPK